MADSRLRAFSLLATFASICLSGAMAAEPRRVTPTELPVLMTETGRNYNDVQILQFDPEGPIFRHETGIAKIPYMEIKEKTRSLLGYPQPTKKKTAAPAKPAPAAAPASEGLIPVRITTHWVLFTPEAPRPCPARMHPFAHGQAAWPFEDPFRPFAAVDLMVIGGVVPHPGWPGPRWIW
jgi:hypothetical protein